MSAIAAESELDAGSKLDALVAEKVMGGSEGFVCPECGSRCFGSSQDERGNWSRHCHGEHRPCRWSGKPQDACEHYSSNIAAAMKVLQKVTGEHADDFAMVLMEYLGIPYRERTALEAVSDVLSRLTPLAISWAAVKTMEATERDRIITAPAELIAAGQRITREAADRNRTEQ